MNQIGSGDLESVYSQKEGLGDRARTLESNSNTKSKETLKQCDNENERVNLHQDHLKRSSVITRPAKINMAGRQLASSGRALESVEEPTFNLDPNFEKSSGGGVAIYDIDEIINGTMNVGEASLKLEQRKIQMVKVSGLEAAGTLETGGNAGNQSSDGSPDGLYRGSKGGEVVAGAITIHRGGSQLLKGSNVSPEDQYFTKTDNRSKTLLQIASEKQFYRHPPKDSEFVRDDEMKKEKFQPRRRVKQAMNVLLNFSTIKDENQEPRNLQQTQFEVLKLEAKHAVQLRDQAIRQIQGNFQSQTDPQTNEESIDGQQDQPMKGHDIAAFSPPQDELVEVRDNEGSPPNSGAQVITSQRSLQTPQINQNTGTKDQSTGLKSQFNNSGLDRKLILSNEAPPVITEDLIKEQESHTVSQGQIVGPSKLENNVTDMKCISSKFSEQNPQIKDFNQIQQLNFDELGDKTFIIGGNSSIGSPSVMQMTRMALPTTGQLTQNLRSMVIQGADPSRNQIEELQSNLKQSTGPAIANQIASPILSNNRTLVLSPQQRNQMAKNNVPVRHQYSPPNMATPMNLHGSQNTQEIIVRDQTKSLLSGVDSNNENAADDGQKPNIDLIMTLSQQFSQQQLQGHLLNKPSQDNIKTIQLTRNIQSLGQGKSGNSNFNNASRSGLHSPGMTGEDYSPVKIKPNYERGQNLDVSKLGKQPVKAKRQGTNQNSQLSPVTSVSPPSASGTMVPLLSTDNYQMTMERHDLSNSHQTKLEKIRQMESQFKLQELQIVQLLQNNPQLRGRISRKLKENSTISPKKYAHLFNPKIFGEKTLAPKISVVIEQNENEQDKINQAKGLKYYEPKWQKKRGQYPGAKAEDAYEKRYNIHQELKQQQQIQASVEAQIRFEVEQEYELLKQMPANNHLTDKEIYAAAMIRHFEFTVQHNQELHDKNIKDTRSLQFLSPQHIQSSKLGSGLKNNISKFSIRTNSIQKLNDFNFTSQISLANNLKEETVSPIKTAIIRQQMESQSIENFLKNEKILDAVKTSNQSNRQNQNAQKGSKTRLQNNVSFGTLHQASPRSANRTKKGTSREMSPQNRVPDFLPHINNQSGFGQYSSLLMNQHGFDQHMGTIIPLQNNSPMSSSPIVSFSFQNQESPPKGRSKHTFAQKGSRVKNQSFLEKSQLINQLQQRRAQANNSTILSPTAGTSEDLQFMNHAAHLIISPLSGGKSSPLDDQDPFQDEFPTQGSLQIKLPMIKKGTQNMSFGARSKSIGAQVNQQQIRTLQGYHNDGQSSSYIDYNSGQETRNQGVSFARITNQYQYLMNKAQGYHITPQNATFQYQNSSKWTKNTLTSKFTGTTAFHQSGPISPQYKLDKNMRITNMKLQVEGNNFASHEKEKTMNSERSNQDIEDGLRSFEKEGTIEQSPDSAIIRGLIQDISKEGLKQIQSNRAGPFAHKKMVDNKQNETQLLESVVQRKDASIMAISNGEFDEDSKIEEPETNQQDQLDMLLKNNHTDSPKHNLGSHGGTQIHEITKTPGKQLSPGALSVHSQVYNPVVKVSTQLRPSQASDSGKKNYFVDNPGSTTHQFNNSKTNQLNNTKTVFQRKVAMENGVTLRPSALELRGEREKMGLQDSDISQDGQRQAIFAGQSLSPQLLKENLAKTHLSFSQQSQATPVEGLNLTNSQIKMNSTYYKRVKNPKLNLQIKSPVKLQSKQAVKNQEQKIQAGESIVVQIPSSPGKRKIALNINQGQMMQPQSLEPGFLEKNDDHTITNDEQVAADLPNAPTFGPDVDPSQPTPKNLVKVKLKRKKLNVSNPVESNPIMPTLDVRAVALHERTVGFNKKLF